MRDTILDQIWVEMAYKVTLSLSISLIVVISISQYVSSDDSVAREEEQEELKQGLDNNSFLDSFINHVISVRDNIVTVFQDLLSSLMGSLLSRTGTYLGALEQRLNITHVIESIGFVKAVRYLVDDASFLISEAKRNLSAISFNVMAPNNDLEGVFNFNFQEV